MLGMRDIVWSLLICGALSFFFELRPAWDARRFVERESRAGFLEAYAGHRFLNGELILPAGVSSARVDPMAVEVLARRLEINAERTAWNGKKAELVVRHLIQLVDGSPGGRDASQDVHVQIEKQDGHWIYTLFEVRGRGAIEEPNTSNPWAQVLRSGPPNPS
jgi:hypothetical protein